MGRQERGKVGSGDNGLEGPHKGMCTDLGSGDSWRPWWAGRTLCAKVRLVSVKQGLPLTAGPPLHPGGLPLFSRATVGSRTFCIRFPPSQVKPQESWEENWEEAPSVRPGITVSTAMESPESLCPQSLFPQHYISSQHSPAQDPAVPPYCL